MQSHLRTKKNKYQTFGFNQEQERISSWEQNSKITLAAWRELKKD